MDVVLDLEVWRLMFESFEVGRVYFAISLIALGVEPIYFRVKRA